MAVSGSPTAGVKFSIGPVATDATDTLSEFQALTPYTPVTGVISMGNFGDRAEVVTVQTLDNARDVKFKGSKNAGSMELTVIYKADDAGQTALAAAADTDFNYAIKIELNDKPNASGTNTIAYLKGIVVSSEFVVGETNSTVNRVFTVEINGAPIYVPATAGA